jgi:4-hydroxythreonine-4-phosphate dehydrogenase
MSYADLPPLAVSMGEPAGIGPDLILRLHAEREALSLPPFVVYGNVEFLMARAARLSLSVAIEDVSPAEAATAFDAVLPVVDIDGLVGDNPGAPTAVSASLVIASIERAVGDTRRGACRGLVTGPIHKAVLYSAGFRYPGHTEFLAALDANGGSPRHPVMMLAHEDLRVVPATIHVPIRAVPALITTELITSTATVLAHDLRTRFGIAEPKLGIAGLNPHAGEGGGIGTEDVDVIAPAVAGLKADGIDIEGPIPADTLFVPSRWRSYDAVIAMYHDQGLIPIKTLAFDKAVNVTLGLNFVRTSPDHGTAFDIAGTGAGSVASMLAAIRMADRLTGGPSE